MGRSRASKEQLSMNGCMARKSGGEVDHWMQDVHPKKGALHAQLHIPKDKKISDSRLEKATHANSPLLRKRANLALRYRGE
jgi:hypothetical protein